MDASWGSEGRLEAEVLSWGVLNIDMVFGSLWVWEIYLLRSRIS